MPEFSHLTPPEDSVQMSWHTKANDLSCRGVRTGVRNLGGGERLSANRRSQGKTQQTEQPNGLAVERMKLIA